MPSTAELVCVDPSKIGEMWPHVAPLLFSALDHTGMGSFIDLEREVLHGNAVVWIAWDGKSILAACATVLQPEDAGLVCLVMACGGAGMDNWLPLLDRIEQWARAEGCTRSRIIGRKGWLKVLDDYREKNVVMEKGLV